MAKCPHGCTRCRAIEAGLGGRPLTHAEYIQVAVVYPESPAREWSPERAEAAAATEIAEVAYEEAARRWAEVARKVRATRDRVRKAELEEAESFLSTEKAEADEQLRKARGRYYTLAREESERALLEEYELGQATQARAREEAKAARESTARRALSVLGRNGSH